MGVLIYPCASGCVRTGSPEAFAHPSHVRLILRCGGAPWCIVMGGCSSCSMHPVVCVTLPCAGPCLTLPFVQALAKGGNKDAQTVMQSWADAEWFTSKPAVAEKITVTVFKVAYFSRALGIIIGTNHIMSDGATPMPLLSIATYYCWQVTGETNTDDLSPAPDAFTRPDIPVHALAMLKIEREGIVPDVPGSVRYVLHASRTHASRIHVPHTCWTEPAGACRMCGCCWTHGMSLQIVRLSLCPHATHHFPLAFRLSQHAPSPADRPNQAD